MFPTNPFLQLVPPRLKATCERLRAAIWSEAVLLNCERTASREHPISIHEARKARRFPLRRYPYHWGRIFDQCWFRLELPRVPTGERYYLHWRDQAEATAYIDGIPYCGFDVAHRYALLPPAAKEVWIEAYFIQSAAWHPGATSVGNQGSCFEGGFLVKRNEEAWDAFHDFSVLVEYSVAEQASALAGNPPEAIGYQPPMEEMAPMQRRLLRRLDEAVDVFDLQGTAAFRKTLREIYRDFAADGSGGRATLVGHAHLDLVWLWPERIGQAKAVHTWSTVNSLMDVYPEMRFSFSQPFCYRSVKEVSPKLHEQIRKRIREGRWEATGGLEVESDTLLPCGEALLRGFVLGQKGFRELTGRESRALWLPDTFGFSACLPQLMKLTGVEFFFTTKLTWGALTRFPYSSFVWRGNDGSEVLAYLTQGVGINGQATPGELRAAMDAYRQSDVHDEILLPTGYGDGGGGPTAEMCERARRLKNLAGLPRVSWGVAEEFFDRLEEKRERLPKYQGELLLEYHRGIFTTHGDLKEVFRKAERGLQLLEAVRCARSGPPVDDELWRRVIFAQFHDHIPGSSIREVYSEGIPELWRIEKTATNDARTELESGAGGEESVFNPLPFSRHWVMPGGRDGEWRIGLLPPLSGLPLSALPPLDSCRPVRSRARALDNGVVQAKFDSKGNIARLRVLGRDLQWKGPGGELILMPDRPHCYSAWEIDRQTMTLGTPVKGKAICSKEEDAGRSTIVFARSLGKKSQAVVRYTLEMESPVLQIEYTIDWAEEETLLKVYFPTEYAGSVARFGHPFGSVTRSQQAGRIQDEALWEVPGSRWAAVCDDGEREGLFVATEAKYGFSCREGGLSVSLLRAAKVTGDESRYGPILPTVLRRGAPASPFSDQGRHVIRLAIGLYDTELARENHPAALAETLFTPPIVYRGKRVDCGFLGLEGGNSLHPVWAQPLGRDRWLLRLHETLGRRGTTRVLVKDGCTVARCDARGKNEQPGGAVEFGPYEVVSVAVGRR